MNKFNFTKTCIGSVPYDNAENIVGNIVDTFKEIPFWPQLPKRSVWENMYAQYSEGFPGIVVDEKAKKVFVDRKKDLYPEIEKVLQKYIDNDLEFFSIKEKYADGLYKFLELKNTITNNKELKFLKGHVTGPVSFGLTVKDHENKSILYFSELEELLPKFLGMKAQWQIRKLKEIHDKVIIFIDEPYVTSIGSSYVSMDRRRVRESINEIAAMIKQEGALSGLHCCGNTEWDFLLGTDVDILSFDAYNFMKEFLLYSDDIKNFLSKDKIIAWGVVPTSIEDLGKVTVESINERIVKAVEYLKGKGIDENRIFDASIITPSCGCGTLGENECKSVFELLGKVSEKLCLKHPTL